MKRKNIFLIVLVVLCIVMVGCTPKEEAKQTERPGRSEQTIGQLGQKDENKAVIEVEAEELLSKMESAMAEKDSYLLKSELLGTMQTADVRKDLRLYDKCRILWLDGAMTFQGEGNLSLMAASLVDDRQKFDSYTWQYYTEETAEGMNMYYTSDFSGKRQQEIIAYQNFAELQKQIVMSKDDIQALVMTADVGQVKDSCHHIDLTLAPYTVPMLQGQLKQAGVVLSEEEWQEAPAVTMTLAISAKDYTLQKVSVDCTPIFEQWLNNEQIAYTVSGVEETPFMTMTIDVHYDEEVH